MKLHSIGLLPTFEEEEFNLSSSLFFTRPNSEDSELVVDKFKQMLLDRFLVDKDESRKLSNQNFKKSDNFFEIHLLDSARSSFSLILESLDLSENTEVIMPAFTCLVVVNPVLWRGFTPVFVDIDPQTFNTNIENLLAAVTDKTKIIFVQHTFGLGISVSKLRSHLNKIGRDDIYIVEDLAHAASANYPHSFQKLGSLADFSLLTFGYEKVISTIRGGGLIVNTDNVPKSLRLRIFENYKKLDELPYFFQQKLLLNPMLWNLLLSRYYFGVGKLTVGRLGLALFRSLGLMGNLAITKNEYQGIKPAFIPALFPKRLAQLGILQLGKLKKLNAHRRQIAKVYVQEFSAKNIISKNKEIEYIADLLSVEESHSCLRIPLVCSTSVAKEKYLRAARAHGYILGDWYKYALYTEPKYWKKVGYTAGSCPVTEEISNKIVNLPTSLDISEEDARFLANLYFEVEGYN